MSIILKPVAIVHNAIKVPADDFWGDIHSKLIFDETLVESTALQGLDQFSHVEILFYMNQVTPEKIVTGARHPRNNTALPKFGIFAQRGKNRPNLLGASYAEVVAVEGLTLTVKGLDAIDGTPVLDVKPCFVEFLPRGSIRQPEWSRELMEAYYKVGTPQVANR